MKVRHIIRHSKFKATSCH